MQFAFGGYFIDLNRLHLKVDYAPRVPPTHPFSNLDFLFFLQTPVYLSVKIHKIIILNKTRTFYTRASFFPHFMTSKRIEDILYSL